MGWEKAGLRWRGCAIKQRAKVGWARAPRQKLCHWGSVLAGDLWPGASLG